MKVLDWIAGGIILALLIAGGYVLLTTGYEPYCQKVSRSLLVESDTFKSGIWESSTGLTIGYAPSENGQIWNNYVCTKEK